MQGQLSATRQSPSLGRLSQRRGPGLATPRRSDLCFQVTFYSLALALRPPLLKDPREGIGPAQMTQDNLPLRALNLIPPARPHLIR